MKKLEQHTEYKRVYFINKWKSKYDKIRVWIGVEEWWASPNDFCIRFCLFGFELSFWFERTYSSQPPKPTKT